MRISDWSSDVCSSDLLDVTPNHRLYASYTRIFQPQNLLDRNLRQLDPLNGNAFEIGLKSSFFGDKLQTSIALFQIKQDNVGQPDIMVTPPGGGLPQQTYVAAEGITSKGVELEDRKSTRLNSRH